MARILVVDDDVKVAELLGRILRPEGHEVLAVATGKEALEQVRRWAPDLVITDINMPDMDGIELTSAVGETSGIPVIAMSGGGLLEKGLLLDNAEFLGAAASFVKPFDAQEVTTTVATVLAGRPGG